MSKYTITLFNGWKWRLSNANGNEKAESLPELKEWMSTSTFPSVVQMELLDRKLIPDPNIGENERQLQWAGEVDWDYAVQFSTPGPVADRDHADLVFDGLDTFASVRLNNIEILKSDNMFIPARVSVKNILKPVGETNTLEINFESALKVSNQREKKYGARTSLMRDRRRMHIRKAQYHWGWDWGPVALTAGPYKPIHLEAYNTRIDNVHIVPKLAADHKSATVSFEVVLVNAPASGFVDVRIVDSDGKTVGTTSIALSGTSHPVSGSVILSLPKLWWPNGQGNQYLYTATINVAHGMDTIQSKFGVRTIELIQRPLSTASGTTFMFRVNGRDIFIQGGDWIPADMFLPSITRKRYFDWVKIARDCHINMIRVWGGGIYETEDCFDACDEMGILVWHDYALACGDYPTHDEFVASVAKEVELQTIRLRNRTSLALLCGGNEDFFFADFIQKINFDHTDLTGPFDGKLFPQRKFYLQVISKLVAALCPEVIYWANSPYGGAMANDLTVGDIHQWEVWHGTQLPYQQYKTLSGRFVSEFGMHGFPVQRTVNHFCKGGSKNELHPQSRLIDCHNKGHGAHTRIARYLAENFRFDMTSLENFVYSSQLMQSEAYVYALQDWKRKFGGQGKEECAGAIIWQLNDVYPGTSWAFIDYFLRPKPAYYSIRRAFAPLSVGIERTPATRWVDEDRPEDSRGPPSFALWAHNTTPDVVKCVLKLAAYDFQAARWMPLPEKDSRRTVTLEAGRNSELGKLEPPEDWPEDIVVILEATLLSLETGKVLARYVNWPEPYRYLFWPEETQLSVALSNKMTTGQWENYVAVSSNHALKGVWLEAVYTGTEPDDERDPVWEDNMFDVLPGSEMTVGVNGLNGRKVKARFLCDWEIKTPMKSR